MPNAQAYTRYNVLHTVISVYTIRNVISYTHKNYCKT